MGDPAAIEPEVIAGPMVPHDPALITAAPTDQVVAMQAAYHDLCGKLLQPSDYQTIGDKQFRKKSGWRKLAVAFNVSTELVDRREVRGSHGRLEEVEIVVRAIAPNGRYMDGIGVCAITERCCWAQNCRLREQWPDGNATGHVHCNGACATGGRHHFSNPAHDLPSTAMTRATNRACADLFGMGEVSAEEITDNGQGDWAPGKTAGNTTSRARTTHKASEPRAGMQLAQKAQLDRIQALAVELGKFGTDDQAAWKAVSEILPGYRAPDLAVLTYAEARHVMAQLAPPVPEQP